MLNKYYASSNIIFEIVYVEIMLTLFCIKELKDFNLKMLSAPAGI